MLFIGIFTYLIAIPLFSYKITPSLFIRITSVTLLFSSFLSYNCIYIEYLNDGISIFSGLFHVNNITIAIETFIFIIGAILIFGWAPINKITNNNSIIIPTINEHSIIIIFTIIGSSLLISSYDLVSIFISIELQSFAVYVIATIYRNSESATAAGLKYFLLGGLSSCFILLGSGLIYSYTGITNFQGIYTIISINDEYSIGIVFGLIIIAIGFLFKIAAAPFHYWAPDVYDGTPTIITAWLSTIPKISIITFLLELQTELQGDNNFLSIYFISNNSINLWNNLLIIASIISLVIGTILGLSQYRIKRLLTFSTISHVGFILLALSINTEESIESLLFYLIQYSITNINVFIILLGFGYIINTNNSSDIVFIDNLKGQFYNNPLLSLSFAFCLFSISGIPPIIGFFAKIIVLYSSIHSGYYFISIIAILVSVISAFYYLKIVKVIYFETTTNDNYNKNTITNLHSFTISLLTMIIIFFVIKPTILLNICQLLSLTIFNY